MFYISEMMFVLVIIQSEEPSWVRLIDLGEVNGTWKNIYISIRSILEY